MEATTPNFISKHAKRIEKFIEELNRNKLKSGLYAFINEHPSFLFYNIHAIEQMFKYHLPEQSIKNKMLLIGNTDVTSQMYSYPFPNNLSVKEDFTDTTENGRKLNATYQGLDGSKPSYFIDFPEYSHYRGLSKQDNQNVYTVDIKELRSMILVYKNQKKVDIICIESLDNISCNDYDFSLNQEMKPQQKERYRYEYIISKLYFFAQLFDVKILFPANQEEINFEEANKIKHLRYINETIDYLDNIILLKDDIHWEFIKKNGAFEY